jgi:hypothetical protein
MLPGVQDGVGDLREADPLYRLQAGVLPADDHLQPVGGEASSLYRDPLRAESDLHTGPGEGLLPGASLPGLPGLPRLQFLIARENRMNFLPCGG